MSVDPKEIERHSRELFTRVNDAIREGKVLPDDDRAILALHREMVMDLITNGAKASLIATMLTMGFINLLSLTSSTEAEVDSALALFCGIVKAGWSKNQQMDTQGTG